jgi:hypothetical protein
MEDAVIEFIDPEEPDVETLGARFVINGEPYSVLVNVEYHADGSVTMTQGGQHIAFIPAGIMMGMVEGWRSRFDGGC